MTPFQQRWKKINMNEQKNLFLAIAISIAIIVFFQLLFPTPISEPIQNAENEVLAPATSIDEPKNNTIEIIKPKEDVLSMRRKRRTQGACEWARALQASGMLAARAEGKTSAPAAALPIQLSRYLKTVGCIS